MRGRHSFGHGFDLQVCIHTGSFEQPLGTDWCPKLQPDWEWVLPLQYYKNHLVRNYLWLLVATVCYCYKGSEEQIDVQNISLRHASFRCWGVLPPQTIMRWSTSFASLFEVFQDISTRTFSESYFCKLGLTLWNYVNLAELLLWNCGLCRPVLAYACQPALLPMISAQFHSCICFNVKFRLFPV